jgi:hypothetical protein
MNGFIRVAGMTLDILRGIQGTGSAATIPASASLPLIVRWHILRLVGPISLGS